MSEAEIRGAVPGDEGVLAEVAGATFALACPPTMAAASVDAFIAEHLTVERFAEHLADPGRDLLVAVRDETAVAYVMLVHGEPYDATIAAQLRHLPTVELSKIYALPAEQGTGLAGRLLDAAVERARARGARGMWLGTNSQNTRAQSFYRRTGFVQVGTRKFKVGAGWEDDYVFENAL